MKTFPTLYQKNNLGSIQEWTISVRTISDGAEEWGEIITHFGQVGGKIQTTSDQVTKGKNPGKKNETTALEQALKEADAKHTKQLKKGYVTTVEAAEAGEVDALVEGGIEPMLAQPYSKHGKKVVYPCRGQKKYDGVRIIAVYENGVCTLWSRTRRPVTGVPHIARAIEKQFAGIPYRIVLDGEGYHHAYKANFEQIVSHIRQETPQPGSEVVQYHIYDLPSSGHPFVARTQELDELFQNNQSPDILVLVETVQLQDEEAVAEYFGKCLAEGYEGAMVRNDDGVYEEGKRSYHLQKVKEMVDADYKIIGFEEGRGKLQGHVAAFVLEMPDGKQFKAKPMGELAQLKRYFEDHSLWTGKFLVTKYQNLSVDGIPRFPVGVRLRDSIDY